MVAEALYNTRKEIIAMKKTANLLSLLLLIIIMFCSTVPTYAGQISENEERKNYDYDPTLALAYGEAHWQDKNQSDGCTRFVKACLAAGGLEVSSTDFVRSFYNTLIEMNYEPVILGTKETTQGLLIPTDSNNLHPGDVIVSYCPTCQKYLHTVIVNDTDCTYIRAYGHNRPLNGTLYLDDCNSSSHISQLTIYGFCLDADTEKPETPLDEGNNFAVEVNSLKVPTNICIRRGQFYGLRGIITSENENLTQISGSITNADTQELVQFATSILPPAVDCISIKTTINDNLVFNTLAPGTYNLTITVYNLDGNELVISDTTFSVVDTNIFSGKKRH